MFEDQRSRKVVLVAHCILNQNAKIDRCAHYPGMMTEAVIELLNSGVGVLQMPCPEMLCLGLDRQAKPELPATIESEDTRVGQRMAGAAGQALCRDLVAPLLQQIEDYRRNGFEIVGVLGINGSPTCGVEIGWADDQETSRPGVFMQMLADSLAETGQSLPMRGVRASQPRQAVETIRALTSA